MVSVDLSRCGEEEQVCAGSLPTDLREGKAFACRHTATKAPTWPFPTTLKLWGPRILDRTFLQVKKKKLFFFFQFEKSLLGQLCQISQLFREAVEEEEGKEERKKKNVQYFYCPYLNKLRCICESVRETSRSETIKSHSCSEGP